MTTMMVLPATIALAHKVEEDEFDSKPLGMKFGISAGEAHEFNELFSFFFKHYLSTYSIPNINGH